MQPLVVFCSNFLPAPCFASAVSPGLVLPRHVLAHTSFLPALMLRPGDASFTIGRLADAIIGLSCISIAAMLASFHSTYSKSLPFRWPLIAVTGCTTVAGLACLFSAVVIHGLHPRLVEVLPLVLAVLAAVCAGVLPYLLPYMISRSRELESVNLAARKTEARFLAAAQSTAAAFFLLEALRAPDGVIEDFLFTYLNASAEKIIARRSSEVLGARLSRILPIDPDGKLFQQFRQVVLTGKHLVHEFPLRKDDPEGPWMRHQVVKLDDGLAITASDITDRKHAEYNLFDSAQHDPLTGLPNRSLLDDRIEQAIVRADRYRNKVGVFLINLDGFEQINWSHGRNFGDEVILSVATRLRAAIRATDTIIRLGGDEFIVVMPDMKLEIDIRRTAATLVAILREPHTLEGRKLQISCSLGVTIYPDTALTVEDLLTSADVAMCRAKMQGKNQYALYIRPVEIRLDTSVDADRDDHSDADADTEQCAD
jgi:diguanylate cyclase (GGDEF)-like protein